MKTGDYEYSAIILPVSGVDKTLTIQSASTGETWEYELTSVSFDEAHKYIYTVGAASGIIIKDNITQWIPSGPTDLGGETGTDPNPGTEPGTGTETNQSEIAKLLVDKTFKPDINYFTGNGTQHYWINLKNQALSSIPVPMDNFWLTQ